MKVIKKSLVLVMVFFGALCFIGCTHDDPIPGPAGADGTDGKDGIHGVDGIDGLDGGTSCVSCHSNSHREPINESFLYSGHYENTVQYNGMTLVDYTTQGFFKGDCAKCHTDEGYVDYMTTGTTEDVYGAYTGSSAISCTTCHDSHSTFDFENDGYDYALRHDYDFDLKHHAAVTLDVDPNYTLDFGNASNNCITCHQPQTAVPLANSAGMFEVDSEHWGPHHGPQSTLLEGIQGAEIAGTEVYPAVGSAKHRSGSSCTGCHMNTGLTTQNGQHSFNPTTTSCTTCHGSQIPSEVAGLADDMDKLKALLATVGIVDADGHPVLGTYTIDQAKAAWNYFLVEEDASHGVHNPNYVKALLKNSIESLE